MEKEHLDKAIEILQANKDRWANEVGPRAVALLKNVRERVANVAENWIKEDLKARYVPYDNWDSPISVMGGPVFTLRLLRLYIQSLEDIQRFGRPRLPGPIRKCGDNQISIGVFPTDFCDKLMFPGMTAEIWLEPGYTEKDIPELQAKAYRGDKKNGKVALVLGAR